MLDFWHFQLEQLHDEFRSRARQNHLWATCIAVNPQNIGTHTIADPQVFLGNGLVAWQTRFDLAGLDNRITTLHALDGAGHQGIATLQEVRQDLLTLGITNPLQDNLLGVLRKTTTKLN